MTSPRHILRRLWQRGNDALRRARFNRALRHIHGPTGPIPEGEVLAIVLVRNGSYYMEPFFDYYRALGIRHFAFIDNGSDDDTIARIQAEPGTIVDQCALPLARYEDMLRAYPAQTYGQDRWCLYVDMDEVFDFPHRDVIGLQGLVRYLEGMGATALVAQMLEMFPKAPLSETATLDYKTALEIFSYFDISTIERLAYHSTEIDFGALLTPNEVTNERIAYFFGGVRGKIFGEACCLTKHPLIFNSAGVSPAPHPHLSMGVRCADITGLIKHYKFAGNTAARDMASLGRGDLSHGEDAARAAVLEENPDVTLFSLDARRWNRAELLVRAGFLETSDSFEAFVAENGR